MNQAIIVTDLGYGDAGKGSMVDYLARGSSNTLVVRHNGGPQAAHNVITPEGRHHTFAQFGSASFVGARTHLSHFMLVNPFNLIEEAEHLVALGERDILDRITIDREAMVITPWHIAANRIRELVRGGGRHGSCGQGIGETKFDSIHFPEAVLKMGELADPKIVREKLRWFQNLKQIQLSEIRAQLPDLPQSQAELEILASQDLIETCVGFYGWFADQVAIVETGALAELMNSTELTIFEGAQAVLLDENYGFHPYTTWSVTTEENARTLIKGAGYKGEVTSLGVLRGYMARHGAGPFVSEDTRLSIAVPDWHNGTNDWQHDFRVGHLDLVALRYAMAANGGVDQLAVTNLDRMRETAGWQIVDGYRLPEPHRTSPYFTGIVNGVARGIRVGPKNRRDYQETITRVLQGCDPVARPVSYGSGTGMLQTDNDFASYLAEISDALGAPVAYASFGPAAGDKVRYF